MKKSFIVHIDSLSILSEMNDEQAGRLLKAIAAYQRKEDYEMDMVTKMAFIPFKNQFLRDEQKYDSIVLRNRNNGSKSEGRPPIKTITQELPKITQNNPLGLIKTQTNPNNLDSVSDNDKVIDNVKGKEKKLIEITLTHPLQIYASKLMEVSKMRSQLTEEECNRILSKFSLEQAQEVLEAMDNTPKIATKYVKVGATLNNWLIIRNKNNPKNDTTDTISEIEKAKRILDQASGTN